MGTSSRRKMEDGRVLVSRFKESGRTQKAFAQDEGINVCSLQYWLRKVASSDDVSKPRFVELNQRTGFGDDRALLSVQIGNDVMMRFATLPPPAYLAELSREMKTC
jgi:hypothetical protein